MRLRIGHEISDNKGRIGIITQLGYKNSQRVISFDGIKGSLDGWCYKEQIVTMCKTDGTVIYSKERMAHK